MRRTLEALFLMGLVAAILAIYNETRIMPDTAIADYYNAFFTRDTGARNGVSAIYLNYRVFDSIFETLILLVSVTAVIRFSWRQGND